MRKVFLSYNRKSEPEANSLASDIELLGHDVWIDQELSGGQVWWDQILARVRDCDVFLFLLNPQSLSSNACKREYGYAAELEKPILPVLVADGVATNLLPHALSVVQFVDYRKNDRRAALRLARAFNTLPDPKPLPDPLPDPPEAPISYLGNFTERVETSATLTYAEQSTLLVDLKSGLRDPEYREDTRTLLKRLRKRDDLFAKIAAEIDRALSMKPKASPPPIPQDYRPR